ncbi:MAG: ATP-binding protein [Chlamydiae bacterium]|nr:ATP-binding protein [Chlamydiota bacterium]MBI3277066.1 ATP-binding protein [Chlamydiota bacterium]
MEINRLSFNELYKEITDPRISILLGARQVGKSTLLKLIEIKAKEEGYDTAFYDLEQPRDLLHLSGNDQEVIDKLTSSNAIIFIDEFHYLKNASKIFKAIYDLRKGSTARGGIKIFASGSSSLEIHKHLKESLAGRFIKTMIFPLSLLEWRQVPGFKEREYLQWGGLPRLIHHRDPVQRISILDNILSTYITKDIKGLIQEENIRSFNTLLYELAQSQGSVVMASNLARNIHLSEPTIVRHLEIMSQTYVLYPISSYSANLANELKKSKKYYFFDLGLRNALLKDFRSVQDREDKGVLYESVVLNHLVSQLKPNMEIRFWRTKGGDEVDFILLKNRIPVPIEVKSKLQKPDLPRGMIVFLKAYPKAPFGMVFNETIEETIRAEGRLIHFKKWSASAEVEYLKEVL